MIDNPKDLSNDQIREHVIALIGPFNAKKLTITGDTYFARDLELDSLTVMDMVAEFEDEFDIILPLNMLPDLETVQQVADAIQKIVAES